MWGPRVRQPSLDGPSLVPRHADPAVKDEQLLVGCDPAKQSAALSHLGMQAQS